MPKCYSEEERAQIIKRLKEEAAKCLNQYGIRRTTVDELVKRAKIPKGTFYLFYPSKEALLFEVILEFHEQIEQHMMKSLSSLDAETLTSHKLTDAIFQVFKAAEEMPILKMIQSDEIKILARKLPPETLKAHLSHDHSVLEQIFAELPVNPDIETSVYSAAFRNIYFATLHKNELGEQHYDEALWLLINGIVLQMLN